MPDVDHSKWETNGKGVLCDSKDLFDEMEHAIISKDEVAFADCMQRGCILPKEHVHVSMLDFSLLGPSRIRVYGANGGSAEMWADAEASLQHPKR